MTMTEERPPADQNATGIPKKSKKAKEPKRKYIPMRFVPAWCARSGYLAYVDDFVVGPPQFKHKPDYPLFGEMPDHTGVAVPDSPWKRVWPYLVLEVLLAIFVIWTIWTGRGLTILIAIAVCIAGVGFAWLGYLKWVSHALVITTGALYRFSAIYASETESVQGADITDVKISYRWPKTIWKALGFATVTVWYMGNSSKRERGHWKVKSIGNGEAVVSLVRGLQRALEKASRQQAADSAKMLELQIASLELQRQSLAVQRQMLLALNGIGTYSMRIWEIMALPGTTAPRAIGSPTSPLPVIPPDWTPPPDTPAGTAPS